jgi:UDP-4-keto-D-QuiNAc 4-reductase
VTGSRVLVTGATGFIGRHLVTALDARSANVKAAVRRSAPFPASVQIAAIDDIGPATDWRPALENCDAVVHLAARVHVMRDSAADPLTDYRLVNADGTLALAAQAQAAGVRRFVFVSSIKESPPGRAFTEQDPAAPVDAYGISKAEAETRLLALANNSDLEVVIIRPPLVYGPGVKANFLSMAHWVSRGLPLPFGALVTNRRSFVALDNLIDLIVLSLQHPAAANQIFLAADGEDLSTAELLARTARALGRPARLVPIPVSLLNAVAQLLRRPDIMKRLAGSLQVDISKARNALGWQPPVSVDEGLRRAVNGLPLPAW